MKIVCNSCGVDNPEDAKYCRACGKIIGDKYIKENNIVIEDRSRKNKSWIYVSLIIAAITILSLLCYANYKPATYIQLASNSFSFDSLKGVEEISITTDANYITANTSSSWISLDVYKYAKEIIVNVSPNKDKKRSGVIQIKAYSKLFGIEIGCIEKTITIIQETGYATYMDVSTTSVSFGVNGGSRVIDVATDGVLKIGTKPEPWLDVDISENKITLKAEINNGDYRTDYFTVESGEKSIKINISQNGHASASISSVKQDHNITKNSEKGMNIKVVFNTKNMKDKDVKVLALFYYEDNTTPLKSVFDTHVCVFGSYTVPYINTDFTRTLFISYNSLNMAPGFHYNLTFDIVIKDSRGNILAREDNNPFRYSNGAAVAPYPY